jgi:predicted CoA-binding protein|tara:strand:+ start:15 stop:443 length:429 start_codon:yes stop_codon:yes gene_type:complete
MSIHYSEIYIKEILNDIKSIAVVGASPNPDRDSYKVMETLILHGYQIFPINPLEEGNLILGQLCYADLSSVSEEIDMVDVFRANDAVIGVTKEAIEIGAKVLWTQLGIINQEASELAKKAGLKVVMNRCPKIELAKVNWKSK